MKRPALNTLHLPRFGFEDGTLESWLAGKDPAKHALADEVLGQIGAEKALMFLLATIGAEEKRRRQRGWRNLALLYGGLFAAQIGLDSLGGHGHHFSLLSGAGGCSVMAVNGGGVSRLHRQCVERLAKIDDKRVFPALVAALVNPHRIGGNAVALRLTRMLPDLEAEDFATLPKAHQKAFFGFIDPKFARYSSIDEATRRDLARALLLAVTRLDNGDALPAMKKVANAKSKTGEDDTLQRTAQNCLPLLEKARDEQKAKAAEERKVVVRR